MSKCKYEKRTGTKTLKTPRLVLRKIMPKDYWSTIEWYTNPDIAKFMLNRTVPSKFDIFEFTCLRFRKYSDKSHYSWAIEYQGKMKGYVELIPVINDDNLFALSFKLDMSLKNQGIMTEAVKAVIEYVKTQDISALVGACDSDNIGSRRVMEKAGMQEYGDPLTNRTLDYADGTHGRRLTYRIRF